MSERILVHEVTLDGYKASADSKTLDFGTWGSYGIENLHLTLGKAWEGLVITAHFNVKGEAVATALADVDNMIQVPWEATKENTFAGRIVFAGNMNGQRRLTANLNFKVTNHADYVTSDPVPTDDKWNQFITETKGYREDASAAANRALKSEQASENAKQEVVDLGNKKQQEIRDLSDGEKQAISELTDTKLKALQDESATQQAAITKKGADTLATIPEEYTALNNDVGQLKEDITEFYKPVSDLDNRKDVDLFISDSYGNVLATFKAGEFATKGFNTVKSIGNNVCDTLEDCDFAISDAQGNVVLCVVDGNVIASRYNAKNHYSTFSILGDSYSTFKDYTEPSNNLQWYPPSDDTTQGSENDVENVENTWWHLFANEYKSLLVQNNSYSGSCISYDSYGTGTVDGKNYSFVKRCENLKKAELIIIEGGTNDAWANVSLGEYKYSDWSESDFEMFRPSCSYVLDYIKRNNVGARIIFILNDGLKASITESIKNICEHYSVDVLELSNIEKSNNHPNKEGMKQIKEQLINFLLRRQLKWVKY